MDPIHSNSPKGSAYDETEPERGQIARLADGAGQNAANAGFPRFSELPLEVAIMIWEMAALDYKNQPRAFQIPNFPWPWDGTMGHELQAASLVVRESRRHALREVCCESRRVFDIMSADVPAANFHLWPRILSPQSWMPAENVPAAYCLYWPRIYSLQTRRSFKRMPACFQGADDFGLFLNPYNIYATHRHSEAYALVNFHNDLRADTLYMPLGALRNVLHRIRGPHAQPPTYILAGDYAYQVPDFDYFFKWRSPPSVGISDDGTVKEVVLESWPASVNSLDIEVWFGSQIRTDWTAVVRVDLMETMWWKMTPQLPASWGLVFDHETAFGANELFRLFPQGCPRHVVFVVERLPRGAERQGPHDINRFTSNDRMDTPLRFGESLDDPMETWSDSSRSIDGLEESDDDELENWGCLASEFRKDWELGGLHSHEIGAVDYDDGLD